MASQFDPVYGFNVVHPSAEDVATLRRRTAEQQNTSTYTDEMLEAFILQCPLIDAYEYEPDDSMWTPTFDLAAAAAKVWEEKAAGAAGCPDFSADGMTYSKSQVYEQYVQQAQYWLSRRAPSNIRLHVDHKFERDMQSTEEIDDLADVVINLPEVDEPEGADEPPEWI